MLAALQASDIHAVATPEGWQPGDKVIVPAAKTFEEANRRVASGEYECTDFNHSTEYRVKAPPA